MNFSFDEIKWFMQLAYEEAQKAYDIGEVPVGAIIVDDAGKVIAKTHNEKEKDFDPTGHAEILCIRKATSEIKNWSNETNIRGH